MNTTNNKILSSLNSENPDSDNVPRLRFPEFTGEWEKKKLGEVAELTSSKRVYANDYVANGIPFYRGKEITELKENKTPTDILYISNNAYEEFKITFGVPQINDLLITAVGTLGNVLTIKSNEPFYFKDGNLIWLKKVNQNSEFLEIVLYFNFKEIEKLAIGSSQKALTMVELRKISFLFPTLPEQTKVAAFLTAVDEKIQALKKKKSLLEQYKKGVMQKLFSQELRFKDDNGNEFPDWEMKKLGEITKITTGSSNRQDSSLIGEFTFFDRSQDIRTSDRYLFDGEAIIVPGEGQEFIPKYFIGKFDLHQRTYAIMDFEGINGIFLFYSISFNTNHLNSHAVGSTVKSLRLPMFETMPINLPCIEEQTKIANFLSAIDEKINHITTQIEKTQVWKKGLLQKMFV
jgi:type I restriction enzyme, S subunit